jgi:CHAD domain-containing protein
MPEGLSLSAGMSLVFDDQAQRLRAACRQPDWTRDVAAVKEARIAGRRLREALLFASPWLSPKRARPVAGEVRWLMRPLGQLRDLDVLTELSRGYGCGDDVLGHMAAERAAAETEVQQRLASARLHRLFAHVAAYQSACDARTQPAFDDAARRRLAGRFLQLAQHADLPEVPSTDQLHDARRWVRRFRYDLETVASCAPIPKQVLKQAKATQDALGEVSDAAAFLSWLDAHGIADASRDRAAAELDGHVEAGIAAVKDLLDVDPAGLLPEPAASPQLEAAR